MDFTNMSREQTDHYVQTIEERVAAFNELARAKQLLEEKGIPFESHIRTGQTLPPAPETPAAVPPAAPVQEAPLPPVPPVWSGPPSRAEVFHRATMAQFDKAEKLNAQSLGSQEGGAS